MRSIRRFKLAALLLLICSSALAADQDFFPIQDVRPGLHGIGKTVFQGDRIEDFQVEILGVLENFGPSQPIILARLSGGPLAETGILQGMSGSPVYIDGKLLGAIALGFPFSKVPIAGIQPIRGMLDDATFNNAQVQPLRLPSAALIPANFNFLTQNIPPKAPNRPSPFGDLTEISTPLSLSGFSATTITHLDAPAAHMGLTAFNGVVHKIQNSRIDLAQTRTTTPFTVNNLKPGSMISVGLITGDWNMTADGTVTYIDGDRIYAFGHRFLNTGATEIPFALSDVITCIPNTNSSFKLSTPRQWVGTITSDRATAIAGVVNRSAHIIPLDIKVDSPATGMHDYQLRVVNDRLLTPFLTQTALFSTMDETEKAVGAGTLRLQGEVRFEENYPPLVLHDLFISDSALTQQASADAVVAIAFILGGGFHDLHIKNMTFHLSPMDGKHQLKLSQAWTSAHDVHPGDTVDVFATLEGENGAQVTKTLSYRIPEGTAPGAVNLTLCDANTLNFSDFAGISQTQFRSAREMVDAINQYRDSESLYVRVWRQQPAYNVTGTAPGAELTDPPPSVVLVLTDTSSSASSGAVSPLRGANVAQLNLKIPGFAVSGAKTIQIEIKD